MHINLSDVDWKVARDVESGKGDEINAYSTILYWEVYVYIYIYIYMDAMRNKNTYKNSPWIGAQTWLSPLSL
jgi:hypothetical protein